MLDKFNEVYLQIVNECNAKNSLIKEDDEKDDTEQVSINVKGVYMPDGNAENLAQQMKADGVNVEYELTHHDSKWTLTGTIENIKKALSTGWSVGRATEPEEILDEKSLKTLGYK